MNVSSKDIEILRRLGEQYARAALSPVHTERKELWRRLNDLESVRPMVWLYQIPWHEMNVDDELTLHCEDEYCRELERELRRELYCCRHMPGDMVMLPHVSCRKVWDSVPPRFGLDVEEQTVASDPASDVVGHRYISQISQPEDLDKIKTPRVRYDAELTETRRQFLGDVFDGILPVEVAAPQIGRDYVISLKPNPAILAENRWRPDQARRELRENLQHARGCNVEIIMKDISTVRYEPQRLWEWTSIASELAEEFAP